MAVAKEHTGFWWRDRSSCRDLQVRARSLDSTPGVLLFLYLPVAHFSLLPLSLLVRSHSISLFINIMWYIHQTFLLNPGQAYPPASWTISTLGFSLVLHAEQSHTKVILFPSYTVLSSFCWHHYQPSHLSRKPKLQPSFLSPPISNYEHWFFKFKGELQKKVNRKGMESFACTNNDTSQYGSHGSQG